jgi:phosphoribosylanthranilate isomerase
VFVKVCGITSGEDALLALAMGADALGFVFAPGSPRQLRPGAARDIVSHLPVGEVLTIGVFRDERPEHVVEVVNTVGLKGAQLHGREPLSDVRYIRERVGLVIQGFAAGDPAMASAAGGPADLVLIDAPEAGAGKVFDWSLAEGAPGGMRLVLAGGLTADNVAEAIEQVRPWGVDVSSGVETTPGSGRKDPRKLRRFVEAAKAAGERLGGEGWTGGPDIPYDWQDDGT